MGWGQLESPCSRHGLILACFPGVALLPSLYLVLGKNLERKSGSVGWQTLLPPGLAWRQHAGVCVLLLSSEVLWAWISGDDFIKCRRFPEDRWPGLVGWVFHL